MTDIEAQRVKSLIDAEDVRHTTERDSLVGAFYAFERMMRRSLPVCICVKVVNYSRKTRDVEVVPLVRGISRQHGFVARNHFITKAMQFAANGFVVDLPIKQGDVGWVIASDRDSFGAKKTHEISNPDSTNSHLYEWGFFIPDYYGMLMNEQRTAEEKAFDGEDDRLVISTFNGLQKVSVGKEDIRINSINITDSTKSTSVIIKDGTTTVNSSTQVSVTAPVATINSSTKVDITTPTVNIKGKLDVTDGVTFGSTLDVTGLTTCKGDVIDSNGTHLGTHTHNVGSATSTAPNPGS